MKLLQSYRVFQTSSLATIVMGILLLLCQLINLVSLRSSLVFKLCHLHFTLIHKNILCPKCQLVQCNIAHALEKTKYPDSDLYWRNYEDKYHFSSQFTADLIAMNYADFIITSTYQEIAGRYAAQLMERNFLNSFCNFLKYCLFSYSLIQ